MKIYLSLGLAGLALTAPVWAQPPKLDANGDGKVTLEEFEAPRLDAARQRFAELDVNGDGSVTLDEFQARSQAMLQRRFAALDTDHDGELSTEELGAGRHWGRGRHAERGSRIDTDGDGAWSFAELQAVRPDLTIEQFNRLDRNGDGLITPDERPFRGRPGPGPVTQPQVAGQAGQ